MASTCVLLLSAACSDTRTQEPPGAKPEAAHTSAQAAAATDLTATDTVVGGVHAYTVTLPPVAVTGTITQTLEASWNTSIHGIREAPIYPQYWSLDYYAGGTKLAKVPATPAEWATVSRVVTRGAVYVEALDGDRQSILSTIDAPPPVVSASFAASSKGDGWDVFFDPEYTRVFNIHHHSNPSNVLCRDLATGKECPGYPIPLTNTAHRSTGHIDLATNKLWQPAVTNDLKLVWDCVDVTASTRCARPVVVSQYTARSGSEHFYDNHIDPVVIGRKMYALGYLSGVTRITCLDMATGTECPGMELPQDGTYYKAGLEAVGNNLYVLPGENRNLDCYDSTTWTRCAGEWPKSARRGPLWGVRNKDGVIDNICANNECFKLDGSAHSLPTNFAARLKAYPVVGRTYYYVQSGKPSSVGSKAAWPSNEQLGEPPPEPPPPSRIECWDLATDAACAPMFPIVDRLIYAATLDPLDPDCVWTNGDDGVIKNYKISTGTLGCGGSPRISFRAVVSIPRLGCDPASRVYLYKSFKLLAPNSTQYTSARLTVKDSTGTPITGWTDVEVPSSGLVDLNGLTTVVAGFTPTFDVRTTGLTDSSVVPRGEFRVTTGSSPQLCWNLAAPDPVCPTTPGVARNVAPTEQPASVTAKGAYTNGSSTTHFTDRVLNANISSNPPTVEGCGTRLRAKVTTLSDGQPFPGAVVYLLDNAGNPILDEAGKPVSAVSAADGTVEFPVWEASYKLKMSEASDYTPVYANVTAGGSGMTFVSGDTVLSNTVTTTRDTTSHVDLTVMKTNDSPSTSCAPPVITGPSGTVRGPGVTVTGTGQPGANITVKDERGNTVCTTTVEENGKWQCDGNLEPGQHRLTADSEFEGTLSASRPQDVNVMGQSEAWFQGTGCAATGGAQPALMMLLTFGGLVVLRRRRA